MQNETEFGSLIIEDQVNFIRKEYNRFSGCRHKGVMLIFNESAHKKLSDIDLVRKYLICRDVIDTDIGKLEEELKTYRVTTEYAFIHLKSLVDQKNLMKDISNKVGIEKVKRLYNTLEGK